MNTPLDLLQALRTVRLRLRSLLRRQRVDEDLRDELRGHLDRQMEVYRAQGLSPADARALAIRGFGNVPLIEEQCRDARRVNWIDDVRRDIGYALRSMRRAPGYTAVASLSLALAIGANTAVFTLVNVLMLRDLPVANPHELRELVPASQTRRGGNLSYPAYEHLRDQNTGFAGVLTMSSTTMQAALGDGARPPIGRFVSGNFFELLGVSPVVGRLLSPADDRLDAAERSTVAVIGFRLWQREFGADPSIAGKTLKIDAVPFTIVGVLPRAFEGLIAGRPDDFFVPMASEPRIRRQSWLSNRHFNWLTVVGRLKADVSEQAAAVQLNMIFGRFLDEFASGIGDAAEQRRLRALRLVPESARAGLSAPRREFSRPVLLLMGAVGLVLLIACANVVNLLFERGMARRHEIGLRLAIGASRGRLVRQLVTEAATLGAIGGAIGLAFAVWGTTVIAAFIADGDPTIAFDIAPDGRVLGFTAVISLGSALIAGAAPAWRAARTSLTPGMRTATPGASVSRRVSAATRALIAAQVALSLVLLTCASLLVTSVRNLRTFDAGFDREDVVLMSLNPGRGGITGAARTAYYQQVLARARSLPGVRAASLSMMTPVAGGSVDLSFGIEGRPEPRSAVLVNYVTDGYFATMGMRLLLGRDLGVNDRQGSPRVALINEAVSRRYFKTGSPIGQRIGLGAFDGLEIVGVVANAKYVSLREDDQPTVFISALQNDAGSLTLAVKTAGDPAGVIPAIRRDVRALAASVPVGPHVLLTDKIDRSLVKERLLTRVLGAFAALALLLAAVGLYGVLGYAVTRRTNEIGIRMALGARRSAILWSVLRESSALVAVGVAIGVPSALALNRLLASFLYGVTPTDPRVLGGAVAALFLVALAAASRPAWRAVRVDPLVALRYE